MDEDPYEPTPFVETNALLCASLVVSDRDTAAERKMYELLDDMLPGERRRLAAALQELQYAIVFVDDGQAAQQIARCGRG